MKTEKKYSPLPLAAALVLCGAAFAFLFYKQCFYVPGGAYASDLPLHMSFARSWTNESYSLLHPLILLCDLTGAGELFLSLLLSACNILSILLCRSLISREKSYFNDFLSVALLFISDIGRGLISLGAQTPNPWHNPTYTLCRPLGLAVLLIFVQIYQRGSSGEPVKFRSFLALTAVSALCMYAKPSFLAIFLPAAALLLVADCIRTRFKRFPLCAAVGACFVPAMGVLLLQNATLMGESGSSVTVSFASAWKFSVNNIPVAVLLSCAFALFMYVFSVSSLGFFHELCLGSFFVGLAESLLLLETGPRAAHGNFMWSYAFGLFMLCVAAVSLLTTAPKRSRLFCFGLALFILSLISGLVYFIKLLFGGAF